MIQSHHFSAILSVAPTVLDWTEAEFLHLLKQVVQEVQLTPVGELTIAFSPQGSSIVLVLAESHVALHVWQEEAKVAIDIHVCNYQQDNRAKAEQLAHLLTYHLRGDDDRSHGELDPIWGYLSVEG